MSKVLPSIHSAEAAFTEFADERILPIDASLLDLLDGDIHGFEGHIAREGGGEYRRSESATEEHRSWQA